MSVALKRLADDRLVNRGTDNTWLLSHDPPSELRDMRSRNRADTGQSRGEVHDGPEDEEDLELAAGG